MNTPHRTYLPASGPSFLHGLLAAFVTIATSPLWGATFTVNTLIDTVNGGQGAGANGMGDLRYCLRRVNDSAQGQTHAIIFAPGVSGKITLKGSELVVGNNVTITGPGADILSVDGGGLSRVLYVEPGHQVQISGLTLTGGNGAGKDPTGTDPSDASFSTDHNSGGAVFNHSSTLTLQDCAITTNSGASGGGIFNYAEDSDATLILRGSSIVNNSAANGNWDTGGGGVLNYAVNGNTATLNASGCTISGNSTGEQGGGGGVSSRGLGAVAKAELSQCSIVGNTSAGFFGGGGIWSSGQEYREVPTTMVLTECKIANNIHTSSGRGSAGDAGGGGILNGGKNLQWSVMTLRNCEISGNKSNLSGGGLCNSATTNLNRSELSLSQCAIHSNEAGGSGGGISNFAYQGEAYLKLNTCTVALNKAQLRGGGIGNMLADMPYTGDVASLTVYSSTIAGNFANSGAGIYSVKPSLYQDETTVSLKLTNTLIGMQGEAANLLVTRGNNVSGGNNLCDDDTGAFLNQTGDKLETPVGLASILGDNGLPVPVLRDNGGPTPTIALMVGSAAIDAGKATANPDDNISTILDQRGLARAWDIPGILSATGGDGSDIGAFEWNSPAITGWRYRYFGITGNSADAADQADPNHNGIPNLIEYALHGDPLSSAGRQDLLPKFTGGAGIPSQFTLVRYPDRSGIVMTVQAASSPSGPWDNVATSAEGMAYQALTLGISITESGPEKSPSVIIAGLAPSLSREFWRLRVETK